MAGNDFYSTLKDTPLNIFAPGVLSNDNDIDGDQANLSAVLVSGPTNAGKFILNADGSFSYTPAVNFTGTDTFTYKANDGSNDGNETTVTIVVVATGNAPRAANDFYNTPENTALNVPARGVLANDNDADTPLANITAILVAGPSHASSFTLNFDGSFDYTPETNFRGVDSFTYKANDGSADSNIAMVTIAVIAANTFPVAINDMESINEDAAKSTVAPGVLGNDLLELLTSPTAVLVSGPLHALSFALNTDGSFNYTPQNDYYGSDSFAYRIFDGTKYSNVGMVNVDIIPVNDVPIAQNQSVTTNENTPVIITLMGGDIDNTALTFAVATPPSHGSLGNISVPTCTAQGQGASCTATLTYTPATNYFGPDSFTFTASDGLAQSALATVSITVVHINRPPAANAGGPYVGNVGIPLQFSGSGNDPDGDAITFSWDFGDGANGAGYEPVSCLLGAGSLHGHTNRH